MNPSKNFKDEFDPLYKHKLNNAEDLNKKLELERNYKSMYIDYLEERLNYYEKLSSYRFKIIRSLAILPNIEKLIKAFIEMNKENLSDIIIKKLKTIIIIIDKGDDE